MNMHNTSALIVITLILGLFQGVQAAANPDLAALAQASVGQFTGTDLTAVCLRY